MGAREGILHGTGGAPVSSGRWALVLMIVFLLGAAAGGFAERSGLPIAPSAHAPPARPAAQAPVPRVEAGTSIVTRTTYTEGDCSQTLEETTTAPADWVGMTRRDLEQRYPDAAITEFSASRVVIARRERGCPYRGRTILLRMGRVAVYYGTLNDLGPLARETDITQDDLTSGDRQRLEAGIVVQTDEEVDALLEGLQH